MVWRPGKCESQAWTIDVCICGMWLTVDVSIDDVNWYEVRLMFMMILIWDDVVIDDCVDMRWCCYQWLCWYEKMLLLMIMLIWDYVVIDDYVDMRLCCCCW